MAERKKGPEEFAEPKASESTVAVKRTSAVGKTQDIPEIINQAPAATSQQEKSTGNPDGFCVYIGPTIHGVIQSGTVYGGRREDAERRLEATIRQYPLIARLIVPGETLAADRVKAKTPGNQLHTLYRRLASGQKQ